MLRNGFVLVDSFLQTLVLPNFIYPTCHVRNSNFSNSNIKTYLPITVDNRHSKDPCLHEISVDEIFLVWSHCQQQQQQQRGCARLERPTSWGNNGARYKRYQSPSFLLIYLSFLMGDQEQYFIMDVIKTGKSNTQEDLEVTQSKLILTTRDVSLTWLDVSN